MAMKLGRKDDVSRELEEQLQSPSAWSTPTVSSSGTGRKHQSTSDHSGHSHAHGDSGHSHSHASGAHHDEHDEFEHDGEVEPQDVQISGRSSNQTLRIYLKKYAFIVKILCLFDFALSIARCFVPSGFWLGFGVVFAPMGFFGAYRFRRYYVLAYALYCVVEVIATLFYTYFYLSDRTQITLFMVSALAEAVVAYYVVKFFRAIPL